MARSDRVVRDEDHAQFRAVLDEIIDAANATFGLLLSPSGQQIALSGELSGADATTLASLAAGNVATTEGLAAVIGESEFSSQFHEGRVNSLHLTLISRRLILVLVFGERSSLGLVRLRVEQYSPRLAAILKHVEQRTATADATSPLATITDEDIESLFG